METPLPRALLRVACAAAPNQWRIHRRMSASVICPSGSDWFFEDPDRAAALIAEAKTWRGTPFRRGSSAKGAGGGIDCVGLDESLLFAVGAVPKFNFPRDRKRDYSRHVYNDRILKYLRGQFED